MYGRGKREYLMMACRVGLGLVFFAFTSKDYRESKKKEEGMGNGDCCFKVKTISESLEEEDRDL